jgi:hypothetical protein
VPLARARSQHRFFPYELPVQSGFVRHSPAPRKPHPGNSSWIIDKSTRYAQVFLWKISKWHCSLALEFLVLLLVLKVGFDQWAEMLAPEPSHHRRCVSSFIALQTSWLTAVSLSPYSCIRSASDIRDLVFPNATATAKRTWELGLDNAISRARAAVSPPIFLLHGSVKEGCVTE